MNVYELNELKQCKEFFVESVLQKDLLEDWKGYGEEAFAQMTVSEVAKVIISLINWQQRKEDYSVQKYNTSYYRVGDICFYDCGLPFPKEAGYQRAGLILNQLEDVVLIVPISCSQAIYEEATLYPNSSYLLLDPCFLQERRMNPNTVLLMNNVQYVSVSRIIKLIDHIDPISKEFLRVQDQLVKNVLIKNEE